MKTCQVAHRTMEPSNTIYRGHRVAVLIPCFNEEHTVADVVSSFRAALPEARILVYDNNSTDQTIQKAREAGAVVVREFLQGKGNVVRRMFADVEADVYLLVDGDGTYDAASAPALVRTLLEGNLDMVNGYRLMEDHAAYRRFHRVGNRLLSALVASIFGSRTRDLLSGYRCFSRRFVKSFPALARGFEIETELTVHALELRMPIAEVETPYRARPAGSVSKLSTVRDGIRILTTITELLREDRPLLFFGAMFVGLAAISCLLAVPVAATYLETGLVPRFPTAILSTGMMLLAFLSAACGLILDTVTRGRREMKRLHYLAVPWALGGSFDR